MNRLVFTLLVSYWSAVTFSVMNLDSYKSTNISHTIHIMKMGWRSPVCVHDVAGKSGVYYLHHEGAKFIAQHIHDENSTAPRQSLMWNVKFRMCLAISYPHLW
jgi:hypothetical protein